VILLKGSAANITAAAADPGALYRVETADGTPLCVVLPGPEYPQIEARLSRTADVRRASARESVWGSPRGAAPR